MTARAAVQRRHAVDVARRAGAGITHAVGKQVAQVDYSPYPPSLPVPTVKPFTTSLPLPPVASDA